MSEPRVTTADAIAHAVCGELLEKANGDIAQLRAALKLLHDAVAAQNPVQWDNEEFVRVYRWDLMTKAYPVVRAALDT